MEREAETCTKTDADNLLGTNAPDATSLTSADLDLDGRTDVPIADDAGRIWEFYQQANGSFTLLSKVWGGSGAGFATGLTITAVDLENDGDTDIIAGLANGALLAMRDPGVGRPSDFTATAGVDSVRLEWDANRQSRIRGYNVYRATSAAGPYEKLSTEALPLPLLSDTAVTVGTAYHYYVQGVSYFFVPGNSEPRIVESLPSTVLAPTAGAICLELRDTNPEPGTYVEIPLAIDNALGLRGRGLAISVTYDPLLLTPGQTSPLASTTPEGLKRSVQTTAA